MRRKASDFKVGLFLLIGFLLAGGGVFYVGTANYMDDADTYVTFFNESVQGLSKDSVVKYQGVTVGRVTDIRVAPDFRLVEVAMDIRFPGQQTRDMVAQLKNVGITGLAFIELNHKEPDEKIETPELSFATEYPVIPSKPSQITQLINELNRIMKKLGSLDIDGMGKKVDVMLTAGAKFMDDLRNAKVAQKLVHAVDELEELVQKVEEKLAAADVGGLSNAAQKVMNDASELLAQGKKELRRAGDSVERIALEVEKMRLNRTMGKVDHLVEGLDDKSEALFQDLQQASQSLTRAGRELDLLIQKIKQNPSQVLFGKPEQPREIDKDLGKE